MFFAGCQTLSRDFIRQVAAGALLYFATVSAATAGHLYGTIRERDQPLRDAEVALQCGNETLPKVRTDPEGVYRVFARTTGTCTLHLNAGGRFASGSLYSFDRPTAYDFDLVNEGGRWILRRR